jgi:hypothetical protein
MVGYPHPNPLPRREREKVHGLSPLPVGKRVRVRGKVK